MSVSYARALEVAVRLAQEAGALLHDIPPARRPARRTGPRARRRRSRTVIRRGLRAAFPPRGYRGEETRPHGPARDAIGHVWLVDPNDGTVAFLRSSASAVSIGLVRAGEPVLGVVYAPCAPDDAGDLFTWAEGCGPPQRNGIALPSLDATATLGPHTVALLSQGADRRAADNLQIVAPARVRAMPSIAYRLALAAAGEGTAASLHTPGDLGLRRRARARARCRRRVRQRDGQGSDLRGRWREPRVGYCFGGPPSVCAELTARSWSRSSRSSTAWPDRIAIRLLRLAPGENVTDAGRVGARPGLSARARWRRCAGRTGGIPVGPRRLPRPTRPAAPHYWLMAARTISSPARPTDDSELALLLARSLVEHRGLDTEEKSPAPTPGGITAIAARAFRRRGLRRSTWVDNIAQALHAVTSVSIREGKAAAAAHAAANRSSQANGALMRVSPIGISGAGRPADEVAAAARADARLTHLIRCARMRPPYLSSRSRTSSGRAPTRAPLTRRRWPGGRLTRSRAWC